MYCSVRNHVSAAEFVWMNIIADCSYAQSCRAPSTWWQPSEIPPALLDFRVLTLNLHCSCCDQIWLGLCFALSTQVQGPSEVPKMWVAFYSHYSSFSHACSHPRSGRSFKRKCQNLIRERLLCFYSLRRPGELIKTAACSCRRLRGERSRQDGKVNRKREKCERGTVHGNVKRREMTDKGECESSLVHSVTMHLSHHLTVTCKWLFLLHLCFSSLLDDLQWKLERVHSLIFF